MIIILLFWFFPFLLLLAVGIKHLTVCSTTELTPNWRSPVKIPVGLVVLSDHSLSPRE